jgi:hypothetical protein
MSDQIEKATDQLSSMADKVAGFAISSYLLLIFACLKDIGPWVQTQGTPFAIGAGIGGIVYIGAVFWLYYLELHVRSKAQRSGEFPLLNSVSLWLVLARTSGIAVFALVGILAIVGASHPPGDGAGPG